MNRIRKRIRQLHIIVLGESRRKEMKVFIDSAIGIQKKRYVTKGESEKSCLWQKLREVQKEIDKRVEEIYKGAKNEV